MIIKLYTAAAINGTMGSQEHQPNDAYVPSQGRFMYADYSPLEDHRNLVEIIKEFVSIAAKLEGFDVENKKLHSVFSDTDSLRDDILAAIKEIKKSTSSTMEKFYDSHSNVLKSDTFKPVTSVLTETRDSLSGLLEGAQQSFIGYHSRYKETIAAQISENNHKAYQMVQAWLANDHDNFPQPILSNLARNMEVSINRNRQTKGYNVWCRVSSTTTPGVTLPHGEPALHKEENKDGGIKNDEKRTGEPLLFSYTIHLDTSELEFWSYRRSVADLGIKDVMIPIGMKQPISDKLKQSFKFGFGKDSEVSKEPEFAKVDNYSLARIVLNVGKALVVELSEDPDKQSSAPRIRISYDLSSISEEMLHPGASDPKQQMQHEASSFHPRIDYYSAGNSGELSPGPASTDLLQIREIEEATDLSKIQLIGSAVLSKLMQLQRPGLIYSRGTLEELMVGQNNLVILPSRQLRDFPTLFHLLESIAYSFAHYVRKMKDTTPVRGELMLRQDLGGGQRREFSVRIDELRSQLDNSEYGKPIILALEL